MYPLIDPILNSSSRHLHNQLIFLPKLALFQCLFFFFMKRNSRSLRDHGSHQWIRGKSICRWSSLRLDRAWNVFARATNRDVSHSLVLSCSNPISTQVRFSRFLQDSRGLGLCGNPIPTLMHYWIDRVSVNMKTVQSRESLLENSTLIWSIKSVFRSKHMAMNDQQFHRVQLPLPVHNSKRRKVLRLISIPFLRLQFDTSANCD